MSGELHPSQNRGLRELYAMTRQVVSHWSALAPRIDDSGSQAVLERGVSRADRLLRELAELTPEYDLYGREAAQGVGVNIARARSVVADRFLENNQAMRLAVLDVQHVVTLLGYLGRVAETCGPEKMSGFMSRWEREMREVEESARDAAVDVGSAPDFAILPLDSSPVGRAAHGVSQWVGTFGEWFDRRRARGG
jgi:hypothetical protein